MKGLVFVALLAGCTIDPVARAELAGTPSGSAIFQRAGTTDQVSFEIELAGPDGSYDVHLASMPCDAPVLDRPLVTLDILDGIGVARGVTRDLDVGSGDDADVIGRALVVSPSTQTATAASCGEVASSD